GVRRWWAAERQIREARRVAACAAAADEIGQLHDREIIIAGAIAYWCEGAKNKPDRRYDRGGFTKRDPGLRKLVLRCLQTDGIPRDRLIYQVQIHESADVRAAQEFWLSVSGADPEQFRRPTLKRHNPRTVRTNTGEDYHGCLRIEVRRSAGLYRKIAGWATAA